MNDKELGKRHLVNLHGIRFHITGDPTSQEARRRIHLAKLDMAELKKTHPGLSIARLERPGLYEIKSIHGIDQVSMTIPEVVEKVEEKKVRKVKEEGYTFVPAICLSDEDSLMDGGYSRPDYLYIPTEADISLCATKEWEGVTYIDKDVPLPPETEYWPGRTYAREGEEDGWIPISLNMEVKPLTNWGNRRLNVDFDGESPPQRYTDSGWNPGPAHGYIPGVGGYGLGYSLAIPRMVSVYGTIRLGMHCHHPYYDAGPECYAILDLCEIGPAPPTWVCRLDCHGSDSYVYGYCCSGVEPCYYYWHVNTEFTVWESQCGGGYLWFTYRVYYWHVLVYFPDMHVFLAVCSPGTGVKIENEGGLLWDEEYGGPNTRQGNRYRDSIYWREVWPWEDWNEVRSGGAIPNLYYDIIGWHDFEEWSASLPSICVKQQSDHSKTTEVYPQGWGLYNGAYIQDRGADAYVCPRGKFATLYFLMFHEYHWEHEYYHDSPSWGGGPGSWVGDGHTTWDDGDFGVVTGGVPMSAYVQYEQYRVLVIDLNGTRYEIDRTDDWGDKMSYRYDEFWGLDSLILDFFGKPVYMYSYCRTYFEDPGGDEHLHREHAQYIVYGYFIEEKGEMAHYQKRFEPAGIEYRLGNVKCLHDVAGSSERKIPKYGFGKCAGYAVKHILEREIPA